MSYHAALFAAAGQDRVPQFVGTATVASYTGGACIQDPVKLTWSASPPATVRVSWAASDKDAALYEFQIFRDDVYAGTVGGSTVEYIENASGSDVVGGTVSTYTSDWVFSVKIVRISDAAVMEVSTAAEFNQLYGRCPILE